MVEQQVLEVFELRNRVVRRADSLLTLQSGNTNSDVRRSDHVDVIGPITYREGIFILIASTHHANNFSFLFGADAAGENDISAFTEVNEFLDQVIVLLNRLQGFTGDNHSVVSSLFGQTLVAERLYNLDPDFLRLELLQYKHVHGIVKQLARVPNVNRRLNLIAREYPELHSRLLDIIDGFTNIILQLILNRC